MSMLGMGLNQDTLKDLKPVDNIVVVPDQTMEDGKTALVEYGTGATDEEGQLVIDNFDDYNVILKDGESLETESVRLEDVAKVVMAAETISYPDIQNYLKMIEPEGTADEEGTITVSGIAQRLDDRVPLSSYTDDKSTVNLEETKKFIKKELKINQDKIHELLNNFFVKKADDFLARAAALVTHIEKVTEKQKEWAVNCATLQMNAVSSKNYLAYLVQETGKAGDRRTKRTLYDIRHVPMDNYKFTDVVEFGMGLSRDVFDLVGCFFRSTNGQSFIKTIKRSGSYDVSCDNNYYRTFLEVLKVNVELDGALSTYSELLAFFSSGEVVAKLDQMKTYIERNMALFTALREACINGTPCRFDNKDYNFPEAARMAMEMVSALCEAVAFCTMAETASEVCMPSFVALNSVLVEA